MVKLTRRSVLFGTIALPLLTRLSWAKGPDDTLNYGLSSFPANLQPWQHPGTSAIAVKMAINRGLLGYGPDGEIRGELAESWDFDGDRTWVFHLRQATFHNGAPVTAQDVKWSLEQVKAPDSTAFLRTSIAQIETIETPDERTVRLVTTVPAPILPTWLASFAMPIIARDSLEGSETGVGAGPFIFEEAERGVSITVTPFDAFYRQDMPQLAKVRFIAYADDNLRVAALQAGDVDIIEFVPWASMASLEADSSVKMDHVDTGIFMSLVFNANEKPFDDPRVRLAIAHAIRREEIVDAVFFGQGATLEGLPVQSNSPIYSEETAHAWNYDPEKAKALLAEAGYPDGFSCQLLANATYSMHRDTGQVVQQHLAEIGIQVELLLPDWPTRVEMGDKGQYQFAVSGSNLVSNDLDALTNLLSGRLSPSNLRSFDMQVEGLDEALDEGRTETDPDKRKAAYARVQDLALEQAPVVMLTWRRQSYGLRADVQGFRNMPGALTNYSAATLESTVFQET